MKSNKNISPSVWQTALVVILLLPFVYFGLREYVNLDFWFDEIYTFQYFVFKSLKIISQDYHVPNNHILFNLINHIYLDMIGTQDLFGLMDSPYKIRILMLLYSIVTAVYIYLIGNKFFNLFIACVALGILSTTIPYYNFAFQVRGYGLSIMLVCMFLYHLFSFEQDGGWYHSVAVIVLGTLLLYTIPLNLYVLSSVMVFYFFLGFRKVSEKVAPDSSNIGNTISSGNGPERERQARKRARVLVISIGLSVAMAVALYLPVLASVVDNSYVASEGFFNANILQHVMPQTYIWFLSKRYLLLPFMAAGALIFFLQCLKHRRIEFSRQYLFCTAILTLPFLMSFVRGGDPYYRVFVNLTPIFSLFAAVNLYYCLHLSKRKSKVAPVAAVILIVVYSQIVFVLEVQSNRNLIKSDIKNAKISQNLYRNYYQAYYRPLNLLVANAEQLRKEKGSLYTYFVESGMWTYLSKFQLEYEEVNSLDELSEIKFKINRISHYFITGHPYQFLEAMSATHPKMKCRQINVDPGFHNLFQCRQSGTPMGLNAPNTYGEK